MMPLTLLYTSPALAEQHIQQLRDEAARDRLARLVRRGHRAGSARRPWFGRRRAVRRPAPAGS
jgi:hypothetical protein